MFELSRLASYQTRFPMVSILSLKLYDEYSSHFHIYKDGNMIGGYRLTPLGFKNSEVEKLFPNCFFPIGSFEIGRFWISKEFQNQGIAFETFQKLFEEGGVLSQKIIFFKSHPLIGIFAKRYGFQKTEHKVYHPDLKYHCLLYRRYPKLYS